MGFSIEIYRRCWINVGRNSSVVFPSIVGKRRKSSENHRKRRKNPRIPGAARSATENVGKSGKTSEEIRRQISRRKSSGNRRKNVGKSGRNPDPRNCVFGDGETSEKRENVGRNLTPDFPTAYQKVLGTLEKQINCECPATVTVGHPEELGFVGRNLAQDPPAGNIGITLVRR